MKKHGQSDLDNLI